MNHSRLIVAGIDTNSGKTLASAIIAKSLNADYWKPIQAGDLHNTDSHQISKWSPNTFIHPEAYRLTQPMSPHAASDIDRVSIQKQNLNLPKTQNNLVIELAGGLMVPLRKDFLNIDWVFTLKSPVVLVSNYYLGSINHTLLSLFLLKSRNIPLLGIIFNGKKNEATQQVILERSKAPCLLEIDWEEDINEKIISDYANKLTL